MKFSVKLKSKAYCPLVLSGMVVDIRGLEFLDIRSAYLHYSQKTKCFECETDLFEDHEEVRLFVNHKEMCLVRNGDSVILGVYFDSQLPPNRQKCVRFIKKIGA